MNGRAATADDTADSTGNVTVERCTCSRSARSAVVKPDADLQEDLPPECARS